jgi:hypothetical protein
MTVASIINGIDDALKERMRRVDCLSNSQFFGLVEPIVRKEEDDKWFPVIIDNQGEDSYVFVDDDYPVGVYHRLLGKSYTVNQKAGFGDNVGMILTVELLLLCWGFRNKINATADAMETMIFASLPNTIIPVQSDFNRNNVFSGEFKNIPFFLPEEVFLFSMKYKASFQVNKRECAMIEITCN